MPRPTGFFYTIQIHGVTPNETIVKYKQTN